MPYIPSQHVHATPITLETTLVMTLPLHTITYHVIPSTYTHNISTAQGGDAGHSWHSTPVLCCSHEEPWEDPKLVTWLYPAAQVRRCTSRQSVRLILCNQRGNAPAHTLPTVAQSTYCSADTVKATAVRTYRHCARPAGPSG